MTLTKDDIADSIYNQCGFSRTKSIRLVETLLELIKSNLESGEDVMDRGSGLDIGQFTVLKRFTEIKNGRIGLCCMASRSIPVSEHE